MISLSICGIFVLGVMFFISDLYLKYWILITTKEIIGGK